MSTDIYDFGYQSASSIKTNNYDYDYCIASSNLNIASIHNELSGYKKSHDILICIFNYRHDYNAKQWKKLLENYFDTVVLDSGNDHKEPEFIQFPNIYYSGLWNEMKKLSKNKQYKFVGIITSDVLIYGTECVKLIKKLHWLLTTKNIGCWSLLGDLSAHSNKFIYADIPGIPMYRAIEGFFMFININVLNIQDYIDTSINKYGHGIDFLTCFISNKLGYINKVDNDIYIYHPDDKGYNQLDADKCYNEFEKVIRKKYPEYCKKTKIFKCAQPQYEKPVIF